jgi:PAS domain S-box-containing protein
MESLLEALKHAADGAYVIDEQQRIVFWNKAAETMLGYNADEVIGRNCYQIFAGRDEAGCPICRWRCLPYVASGRGEPVQTFDAHVRGKDGHPHWVSVSILSLPDNADTPCALIHLFRNIDSQKQMESFVRDVVGQARQFALRECRPATPLNAEPPPEQLTAREFQVLALLAQGIDTAAIAQKLIINEVTVRNHIQHILHKLNVHSRLEAVAYAHEHDLL